MIKSPLAGWMGGKFQLSKQIVSMLPEHECYCEPFAGAAWVLFRKPPSSVEVVNDINADLVTLYRVIQHHLEEFVRWFKWLLVSRSEFERFWQMEPASLTDIQRAVRFFYLQKNAFGGRISNPTFGYSTTRGPRLNLLRIEQALSDAHLRLAQVFVENLPFLEVIDRYDRPHTFFYIDPPYWDCEDYYGAGIFGKSDFQALSEKLATINGKFLLSLNDTPEIRSIFSEFLMDEVTVTYSCGTSRSKAKEVLIRNYEL